MTSREVIGHKEGTLLLEALGPSRLESLEEPGNHPQEKHPRLAKYRYGSYRPIKVFPVKSVFSLARGHQTNA